MNMNLPKKMLNHHMYTSEIQNGDCIDWYLAVNSKFDELMSKHNINVTDNRYYWQNPRFLYELWTLFKIPYWVRKTFEKYSKRKKNPKLYEFISKNQLNRSNAWTERLIREVTRICRTVGSCIYELEYWEQLVRVSNLSSTILTTMN